MLTKTANELQMKQRGSIGIGEETMTWTNSLADLLRQEIDYHVKGNTDIDHGEEWKRGFIEGVQHSRYLILKLMKVEEPNVQV